MRFVLILIFFSLTSCFQRNEQTPKNSIFISEEYTPFVEIDFNLKDSTFIEAIEKQTKIDLCENSIVNAMFKEHGEKVIVPVVILKDCEIPPACIKGIIDIELNSTNKFSVSDEVFDKAENFSNKIIKLCEVNQKEYKKKWLAFNFKLGKNSNGKELKKLFFALKAGINQHYNNFALEKFKKPLHKCSLVEKSNLRSEFDIVIGLQPYHILIPPPPPPPPPSIGENK